MSLKTKIIALIAAGSIASTAVTPVQADPAEDLAKILIGIAIVSAIANADSGHPQVTVTTRDHRNDHRRYDNRRDHRNDRYRNDNRRDHRHDAGNGRMPRECKVTERTRYGWTTYFKPRCMSRYGYEWSNGRWVRARHAYR